MATEKGARRVHLGAEIALAFAAGIASFAVVAVALAVTNSNVLAVVLGVVCVVAVAAMFRFWGVAYAIPAAMAGALAYDWFHFPPTHPRAFPDSGDLANLLAFVAAAVAVGEFAAYADRRADVSEVARSELAEEQAALRRVATLVARGVSPDQVFAAVAREVGALFEVDGAGIIRYEDDDDVVQVAGWAVPGHEPSPLGRSKTKIERTTVVSEVLRTGRVARIDDYASANRGVIPRVVQTIGMRSGVGAPIVVGGRLWGVMIVWSLLAEPLADTAEARLADFTGLVATAISNTASREELARLADEQAALRRVATLVAQDAPPGELFSAVAGEVGRLLDADSAAMIRYEDDETVTFLAEWGEPGSTLPPRTKLSSGGENVTSMVLRTGRPARIDDYAGATGAVGDALRHLGTRSALGCPIVVDGRLWGAMIAAWGKGEPAPAGTESRIGEFTELIATAIANAQARSDLAASRARIAAAADQERQRVVRDLHDGAQQRVVHTIITLKLAHRALQNGEEAAPQLVAEALQEAEHVQVELHELAHGILPTVLTQGGLRAGVEALALRTPVPVEIDVSVDRLPDPVEATAYFVVAEALTNVAKHSKAQRATVAAHVRNGTLELQVRDDGVGGAQPESSGLLGLGDRLAALDGRLRVKSPAGGGTVIAAAIPLGGHAKRGPGPGSDPELPSSALPLD